MCVGPCVEINVLRRSTNYVYRIHPIRRRHSLRVQGLGSASKNFNNKACCLVAKTDWNIAPILLFLAYLLMFARHRWCGLLFCNRCGLFVAEGACTSIRYFSSIKMNLEKSAFGSYASLSKMCLLSSNCFVLQTLGLDNKSEKSLPMSVHVI